MIIRHTRSHLALLATAGALIAPGCTLEKSDDVSEYREALPEASNVRVAGPEGESGGERSLSGASSALLSDGAAPAAARAEWYRFTRDVRDGVNLVTAGVLGSVWYVVHTRPTIVGEDFAEWGPHTDALDPVTYRLRVERVGEHEYDYRLDGRPRSSDSEDDYLTVLRGKGYGRADARHGDGHFTIDLDAQQTLDPDRRSDGEGTIAITHDLPASIRRELGALPREITAVLDPPGDTELTIVSKADEDGSGELDVSGRVDIDESKQTAIEDVAILSRFRADGAGRADVVIASGDVPDSIGSFSVSECWGSDFSRTFYEDSVEAAPTEGDPSACVYEPN